MKIPNVPFIPNTPDDTHCLQASYMSIAKYFDPTFSMNMTEWSTVTGYEEGLGTWANAGLVWFSQHGYDVVHYELFDFNAFIQNPLEYMIELHGKEAGEWGIEHTNIPAEIERMETLKSLDITKMQRPTLSDIRRFLREGYLVRVTVNASLLESEPGYVGHAVSFLMSTNLMLHFTIQDCHQYQTAEFQSGYLKQHGSIRSLNLMQ